MSSGGQAGDPLDRAARPVRRPGGGRGGEARRVVVVARLVEMARINSAYSANPHTPPSLLAE